LRESGRDLGGGSEMLIAPSLTAHNGQRYNVENESFIAFDRTRDTSSGDISAPLRACGVVTEGVNDAKADTQCIAFAWQQGVSENDRSYPVRAGDYAGAISGTRHDALAGNFGVRRLTPTECERLQGFPDGWTADQADTPRYKQLGNAVCVPVIEWIGRRIVTFAEQASPPLCPSKTIG
jgi:DNA (cytosine-5)-methyltransferase 1